MQGKKKSALAYAFPKTLPVMAGYLFLGMAYGVLMSVNGFSMLWTAAMSIFVYAGSMQYMAVLLFVAAVGPVYAFLMALMVNARHLFYGISMLDKYRGAGKWKPLLVFLLTDETFSVVCNEEVPKELPEYPVYAWISVLDYAYWIIGSLLGAGLGNLIPFSTEGLDFALTALFLVIFTEQWLTQKKHRPAVVGILATTLCLVAFGSELFIIPAMAAILAVMTLDYQKEQQRGRELQKGGRAA